MNCLHCNTPTDNPRFCTRSCAASYNNTKFPKRKSTVSKTCTRCEERDKRPASQFCQPCRWEVDSERIASMTLSESLNTSGTPASIYNNIRHHARKVALKLTTSCVICSYDKIVNVCHVKGISSFPLETKVSEINSLDNLTVLCPNHHWELDHDLLEEEFITLDKSDALSN